LLYKLSKLFKDRGLLHSLGIAALVLVSFLGEEVAESILPSLDYWQTFIELGLVFLLEGVHLDFVVEHVLGGLLESLLEAEAERVVPVHCGL
jgi:hypothetical protein